MHKDTCRMSVFSLKECLYLVSERHILLFVKTRLEQLLYIHEEGSYWKTLFPEVGPILIFVVRIN